MSGSAFKSSELNIPSEKSDFLVDFQYPWCWSKHSLSLNKPFSSPGLGVTFDHSKISADFSSPTQYFLNFACASFSVFQTLISSILSANLSFFNSSQELI
jgi:hypothetical protein